MSQQMWAAPTAIAPVRGTVTVPGSKSITNRALILAAISQTPSTISNVLVARDTQLMVTALQALGVDIDSVDPNHITIVPSPLRGPAKIDCGLAGTLMRFLPPLAATADGAVDFDGDDGARRRPMSTAITALRDLGVEIADDDRGRLPFTIAGTGRVRGGEVVLDASASSQFVSGLLLSAPRFASVTTVRHQGPAVPSLPHIEMTIDMLRAAGVHVAADTSDPRNAQWTVTPGPVNLGDYAVEPDLSNASAFLAAAMVTGGSVTVPGWPRHTTQAGDQIRGIFTAMGAVCELSDDQLRVTGPQTLAGIDVDLRDIGELTPTIAAVAAFATGPSRLTGIAHLRGHETNRLAALVNEINRLGGSAAELEDGIVIEPSPLSAADVATYHDHRMATFGAIVGLRVPGTRVENIATTAKTMPEFASMWAALLNHSGTE
ncbi:MAG: 3-phosphoshikimate 1-carboxyvinyltransferase [Candidatus Nanopelagicales bacterium]